jgi:dolichyl-phosphate-mannose-protein mannosyltransferase
MSSQASLRKRGGKKDASSPSSSSVQWSPSKPAQLVAKKASSDWDYKIAIVIMTLLAFATRFYKISYPDEVVFDEVHFGKVGSESTPVNEKLYSEEMNKWSGQC